jgi:FkbM family methyltransferase
MSFIKKAIKLLPFNFTLNQQYDSQTRKVIGRHCSPGSNCIDVGCHKGEILDLLIRNAPQGTHWGFEPIPVLYQNLLTKYSKLDNCRISNIALSDTKGTSSFNYVVTNPAYSGLVKRQYDRADEKDQTITVNTDKLDDVLPADYKVDLIKIDVEGGEMLVLKGAVQTLKKYRPLIIFEHGLGASDCYGTKPSDLYNLLTECGYKVSTMKKWLAGEKGFTLPEFESQYFGKINYYFIAYS